MSYSTHSFPEFGPLTPQVEDSDPVYVEKAALTLKDIFGERQEMDLAEYDAPGFAKSEVVRAARVIHRETDNQTLGEVCELVSDRAVDLAEERGVSDLKVTPEVLAVAGYAMTVLSLDWGVDELGDDWDANALVLVHDHLHDLKQIDQEQEEE